MATKSYQKMEVVPYITPWLVARFPKISTPDTNGKFADGKFKTDGLFQSDADYDKALADAKAAAAKLHPNVPLEDVQLPIKEFFGDKEKTKSDGMGMTLKSKYRPLVLDAKKNKLPEGKKIGGGSVLRVDSAFFPWEKTEKVKIKEDGKIREETQTLYGVSLRLGAIQVRSLSEGGGQSDGSAFDAVEGFEYDEAGDEQTASADDATAF